MVDHQSSFRNQLRLSHTLAGRLLVPGESRETGIREQAMSKVHDAIDARLAEFLTAQPVFFVGTAPLSGHGRVNVSPKGLTGTFAVLGPLRVAYLDYTGSGAETIAHLRENGRIVLMFCAFEGAPNIVRLHGRGRVVLPGDDEFATLRNHFDKQRVRGQRSIVVVDVERVADSCGWAVPRMDLRADRDLLDQHAARKDDEYFETYWRTRNATSIDGLAAWPVPAPAQKASALPET
jgi:Pyridoxamine 5'-phosphate oxidase